MTALHMTPVLLRTKDLFAIRLDRTDSYKRCIYHNLMKTIISDQKKNLCETQEGSWVMSIHNADPYPFCHGIGDLFFNEEKHW